jgi:pimeloyl-ACP methyl ester carboxylesterase
MDTETFVRTGVPKPRRPPVRLTAAELMALISTSLTDPVVSCPRTAHRGDGHAILVLPGLFAGDASTNVVREFLTSLRYSVHGWNLGTNIGPTKELLDGATDRLIELSDTHGPLSVVGFSMGGLFARWLSLRMPERVRQVITVCTPIYEPIRNFWLPVEPFLGLWPDHDFSKLVEEIAQPLPVPGTFLFSRDDGAVNNAVCQDINAKAEDNIEISGPHVLVTRNPRVMEILAQRLARRLAAQSAIV